MAVCSVLLFWHFHGVFLVCVCSQSSLGLLIDHPLRDSQALTFLIPVSCPHPGWFKLYTQILWAKHCHEATFYIHVYVKARHKDTSIWMASTPHCRCIFQNSAPSSLISLQLLVSSRFSFMVHFTTAGMPFIQSRCHQVFTG